MLRLTSTQCLFSHKSCSWWSRWWCPYCDSIVVLWNLSSSDYPSTRSSSPISHCFHFDSFRIVQILCFLIPIHYIEWGFQSESIFSHVDFILLKGGLYDAKKGIIQMKISFIQHSPSRYLVSSSYAFVFSPMVHTNLVGACLFRTSSPRKVLFLWTQIVSFTGDDESDEYPWETWDWKHTQKITFVHEGTNLWDESNWYHVSITPAPIRCVRIDLLIFRLEGRCWSLFPNSIII